MESSRQLAGIAQAFERRFGAAPERTAFAPGRVNLLGEHTDYNGGYVMPMALRDLGVSMAMGRGTVPGQIELHSTTLDSDATRRIDDAPSGAWSDYVLGCVRAVATDAVATHGLRVAVSTSLPLGAGLSSSAALEVASLRAVTGLIGRAMDPVEIARTAKSVENDFVGMPCGIMDQFASSVGAPGTAVFLDTRTLEFEPAPCLAGYRFAVIDSGVSHQLTDSGYATRVAECKAACQALGVDYLSALGHGDLGRIDALPSPLDRRARHIVTDNRLARAGLDALKAGDAATFGRLMVESHATARDNYEITVPETDAIAAAAVDVGALGARQTGGGWGGAVVALVPDRRAEAICTTLTARFPGTRVLAVT